MRETTYKPSPFLILEEVQHWARTNASTVRFWLSSGKLPSTRPGRRRLVKRADLAAFLGVDVSEIGG